MRIKAGDLRELVEALVAVKDTPLPTKTAYWLARARQKLVREHEAFESVRLPLIEKYGRKDKDGKLVTLPNGQALFDDFGAFGEEYAVIAAEEIEIDIRPFSLEAFEGADGKSVITPGVMSGLLPLIEEEPSTKRNTKKKE